jgi:phage terminase large subunit-like protein
MGRPPQWYRDLPSRLPRDFVDRTIARFLPPDHIIAQLGRDDLLKLAERKRELEQLIVANPVRFFQPATSGDQRAFMTNDDETVQGLYFFAANKTGKTTGGAIVCGEFAEGKPIWETETRNQKANYWLTSRPKRIAFFCEDFSTHEETIVPTYATWMKNYIREVAKGPSGNLSRIIHKNGSIVYLRTYDQGYEKAEGKDYDFVWTDEPPPRDIYTAIFRGLVATRGRLLITATLLSQTWLYDEMRNPFVKVYEATMHDNNWLDNIARQNFISILDDAERNVRIFGGRSAALQGKIYSLFRDDAPYIIPYVDCPWNPKTEQPWPIIVAIDPHDRRPLYMAWAYITPKDHLIWFDWAHVPSIGTEGVFKEFDRIEKSHKRLVSAVVLDPNYGNNRDKEGRTWKDEFESRGYQVIFPDDHLDHGHSVVRDFFSYKSDAENKVIEPPRMQFMTSCRGNGGPVFSLERYIYEEWKKGSRFERTEKEKPAEKWKDFPDTIRYGTVALHDGLISYTLLTEGINEINLFDHNELMISGNPYLRSMGSQRPRFH